MTDGNLNISVRDIDGHESSQTKKSRVGFVSFVLFALVVVAGTVLVVSKAGFNQIKAGKSIDLNVAELIAVQTEVVEPKQSIVVAEEPKAMMKDAGGGAFYTESHPNGVGHIGIVAKAAAPLVVVTLAGTGANNFPIDESTATLTPAGNPRDIIFDSSNNLYYSDSYSFTIRLISAATGRTTSYAGSWSYSGNGGDNGPATSATFLWPFGLSWDANGNMLIADNNAHVIRRISVSSMTINRVAGTGTAGYSGDQLYSTASMISSPWNAITDAANNIFISDFANCRIRKVLSTTSTMVNFAGTGTCNAGTADGLTALASNFYNLGKITFNPTFTYMFVPEWNAHRVRRITMSSGVVTTVAGVTNTAGYTGDGMAATSSRLYYPRGVRTDAAGTGLYIAEWSNHIIRYVSSTGIISTAFGIPGSASFNQDGLDPLSTNLYNPETGTLDANGFLVVADLTNYRIRGAFAVAPTPAPTLSPTASATTFVQTIVGTGADAYPVDGTLAVNSGSGYVRDIVFDSSNNLYYSDSKSNVVRVVYAASGKTFTYAGTYRTSDNYGDNGPALKAAFGSPFGLSWDLSGNMLVTDTGYHTVRKITVSTGIVTKIAGTNTNGFSGEGIYGTGSMLYNPHNAIVDGSGNIYISDWSNCRIRRVLASNNYMYTYGGNGNCASGVDGNFIWNIPIYYIGKMAFGPSFTYLYFPEWSSARVRRVTMSTGIVTTIAGQTNSGGYSGDGGLAVNSVLNAPRAVKTDRVGGVYIIDWNNHAIRYVSASGIMSTVAGGVGAGFNQDGLSPTATKLYNPETIAIDNNGYLVIGDLNNNRIRGVYPKAPTGVPTRSPTVGVSYITQTVAGTGVNSFPIDLALATQTPVGTPRDILFDSKNHMYYSDDTSNTIRVVNATTGITNTFAGTYRTAGFSGDNGPATAATIGGPYCMNWDVNGNLLFTDNTYHVIRKIVMTTKYISKVAGIGGSYGYSGDALIATNSLLYNPWGVAADASNNVYISDHSNCRLRKVTNVGVVGYMYNWGGTGSCAAGEDGLLTINSPINYPLRLATDATRSNLYMCEWNAHRVRKINFATTIITTVAGIANSYGYSGDGGLAVNAKLYNPRGVRLDSAGNIFITEWNNHAVRYINADGIIDTWMGGIGAGFNQDGLAPTLTKLQNPETLNFDKNGFLYVTDVNNYRIRGVFTKVPTFAPTRSPTVNARAYTVRTIAGNGNDGYTIDEVPAVGNYFSTIQDILFDSSNNMYLGDYKTCTIRVVYSATGLTYTFAGTYRVCGNSGDRDAITSAKFTSVFGLNWDRNGNMLAVDNLAHVVRVIDMGSLTVSRLAGSGSAGYNGESLPATISSFNNPDTAIPDGNNVIYVADHSNCRVRRIANTVMTTFAGNGGCSSGSDGLLALNTPFYYVQRITFDSTFNNLYVCEWSSARVRKIIMSSTEVVTVVGTTNSGGYSGDGGYATNALTSGPRKVVFDRYGGFYLAEWYNHAVRYVTKEGIISTYIGGIGGGFNQDNLIPTLTKLNNPMSIALDANGYLVVSDYNNFRIRGVYNVAPTSAPTRFPTKNLQTSIMTTFAGNGGSGAPVEGMVASNTQAGTPSDIIFDSAGNLYYGDNLSYTVRVIYAATGTTFTFAGTLSSAGNTGNGGAATSAKIQNPVGTSWDNNGNMLITDWQFANVRRVNMATKIITAVAGTGTAGFSGEAFAATNSMLNGPHGAVTDLNGNIYIADHGNCRVRQVLNADQKMYTVAGNGGCSSSPDGLQGTSSTLYGVVKLNFNPAFTHLYFNEWSSHRVRVLHVSTGVLTTAAGVTNSAGWSGDGGLAPNAQLYYPRHIYFDKFGGFYISEWYNHDVRYVSSDGIISTVAGVAGAAGYNQDGIAPTLCKLNNPNSVALDAAGNLYIADNSNYRIRRVIVNSATTGWPTSRPSFAPTVKSS